MTKRIFRSICVVAVGVLVASIVLFMGVLYDYFSNVQRNQLKIQTELTAQAVANEGSEYFDGLEIDSYRITWIGADGEVLYDNRSDSEEMENHLERAEIKEAIADGYGESSRYSATLMERTLYCAKLLPDGTVVRLSVSQSTLLTLTLGMLQPICVIIAIALVLSLVLASRLSKQIVRPLNEMNLDDPLSNDEYDELAPFLRRIDRQQREIRWQSEQLRQKQREFEMVTENMTEGIILLDSGGIILGMNRAAMKLFGADHSCIGQHILSVNRNIEISDLLHKAEKGLHTEKTISFAGGKYQLIVSPVLSGDMVSGAVLLAINVTEKEDAEQMRREFTANVSHELKTPLHTIAGSAELLAGGMVNESDKMGFYTRIYGEAQRMIRLVEDIIKLSHLDEGAEDMNFEESNLYAIAEETVRRLTPEAESAGVMITLEGEPVTINGIPRLLQSIIYNLCDNAIKYNRKDGSVTVSVRDSENGALLSVSDTGIGIPLEHQSRIFERFYRVDKSRSKELGGTGLGLSIVKHGARIHEAGIEINSVPDGGTTIILSFPKRTKQ